MSDRLIAGQEIPKGERVTSADGGFYLAFQTDDNLVLYNRANQAIWASNTMHAGASKAILQTDGNFVLYTPRMAAVWNSGSWGKPGAYLVVQNDGNVVIYVGKTAVWSTQTYGGHYHEDSGNWFTNAVSTCGRALASASGAIGSVISSVADLAANIPLVGGLVHGVLGIVAGPFRFTESMLEGERIDRALLADLKSKVAAYQEIAPYAATIVSFVPGVGSGVAGAIGASTALLAGMPIDEAVIQGVKGALPGGKAAQACFSLTVSAVRGENIVGAAGDALVEAAGLPPQTKNALTLVYRAAKGENIPKALLDEAYNAMPNEDMKHAAQVAIAIAHGKKLQDIAREEIKRLRPDQIAALRGVGEKIVNDVPVFHATAQIIQGPGKQGYQIAVGLMHHAGVAKDTIQEIRKKLKPDEQRGFDMGVSSHIAAVIAPSMLSPEESKKIVDTYMAAKDLTDYYARAGAALTFLDEQKKTQYYLRAQTMAGYLLAYGMRGYPGESQKASMMQVVAADQYARAGATIALSRINATASKPRGVWAWLKHVFGRGG